VKVLSCLLVAIALTFGQVRAQTYSLASGWNPTTDSASDQWAYGTFSSGSTFVVPSTAANNGSSTEDFWTFPPVGDTDHSDPNIEKNLSATDYLSSNVDFRPGTVSFGPYQGPAVAQFLVPTAGLYSISATFQTDQIRTTMTGSPITSDGTTAYVYIGGMAQYAQQLTDPNGAQFGMAVNYTVSSVALLAGETVDFAVGGGAFTTQVDATLTSAPEPSAWAMLTGGLVLVVVAARRRRLTRAA
jgi:hypothetical protein